jgi:hypothetical protein
MALADLTFGGDTLQAVKTTAGSDSQSGNAADEQTDAAPLPVLLPAAFAPLVTVVVDERDTPGRPRPPAGHQSWRELHLQSSGHCGRDIKRAFHEGLRTGGRTVVFWPAELGEWRDGVAGLLRPILTRRADVVLPGFGADAARAGLQAVPGRPAGMLLRLSSRFITCGPVAITRRALDALPFEANDDGPLFSLQLLAQALHFALETAPCILPATCYQALQKLPASRAPAPFAQLRCSLEFLAHRWGLTDSPRFDIPQMPYISRRMISRDRT